MSDLSTIPAPVAAALPVPPSNPRYAVGQRTLKMIAARCDICQREKNHARNWWAKCPHNKYVTQRPHSTVKPKYEPILEDGKETGKSRLIGEETITEWVSMPNWKEVALSPRINRGRGYFINRSKGSIMPSELITPEWPNGGLPVCQYRGCFKTEGLREYATGVFHHKLEAQLVYFDQTGKTLEYLNEADMDSMQIRRGQLAGADLESHEFMMEELLGAS